MLNSLQSLITFKLLLRRKRWNDMPSPLRRINGLDMDNAQIRFTSLECQTSRLLCVTKNVSTNHVQQYTVLDSPGECNIWIPTTSFVFAFILPSTFIPSNLVLFKSITSRNSRSLSTIFLHVSCSILISHQDHSLPTQNAFFNSPSWRSRLISFLTKYHLQ